MKGIKLTPFLLFLILLVVLVIAMIFGYYSKPILESMTSGASTSNWVAAGASSIQSYDAGTALDLILSPTSTDVPGYYFDSKNGNIVVSNDIESDSFVLITRKSQGVPTTVTSGYTGSQSPGGEDTIESMATPWSYYDGTMSLLYAPYQSNTLVILINNGTNEILSIYKSTGGDGQILETTNLNGGAQTGITADADLSLYSRLGSPVKDSIIIGQENVSALKIQENVYYASEKGVIVGKSGTFNDQSLSSDYMNGVSKQNNGGSSEPSTILVLSCMIDQTHILVAIIVKVGTKYQIASSNVVTQQATSGKDSSDDNFAISITTNSNDSTLGNQTSSTNASDSTSNKDDSSSKDQNTTKHKCDTSITNKSQDSDYIKKTEIVPPVCPACPTTNCPISINSSGQIVDCTGKEVNMGQVTSSSPGSYSSAPQTIAGAIGGTAEQTVKSVGDTLQTGLTEAGDTLQTGLQVAAPALETTVNTAGDVLEKGLDTAGGALDSVIGGTENIVGKVGEGLGDVGQGASDLIQGVSGDVASLGKDAAGLVTGAGEGVAGLAYGAGEGAYDLTAREQDLEQEKMELEKQKKEFEEQKNNQQQGQQGQQGQQQQGQQGYSYNNQQMGYDYNQQQCCYQPQYGQGYSHPRTCSSNFMPITNDFSQFT